MRACRGKNKLEWDVIMEEEYRMVKDVMREQLRLSTYDESNDGGVMMQSKDAK